MKSFKDLSIKVKAPIMLGIASLLIMTGICLFLIFPFRSSALERSSSMMQSVAVNSGLHLAERINGAADVVRAFSGVVQFVAESDVVAKDKKRELIIAEMEMMVKKDKKLNNLWCTMEPDALDGMDAFFINRMGSDERGVFGPWYTEGELSVSDSEADYEEDFYRIPKLTRREAITEPYWDEVNGEKIHMFSVVVPVMSNDNFLGVVGVDFYVTEINSLIESYSENTTGKLVTNKGAIAVYHDVEQIGKKAEQGNFAVHKKLSEGKMFHGLYRDKGEDVYKIFVPVHLGEGNDPWFYAVDIPIADIYVDANETSKSLITYCLLGVVLIVFVGWLLIQSMLKGVTGVINIIRRLSLGHINIAIGKNESMDEIGMMRNELHHLVEGLKHTAGFAQNIGKGNLDAEYHLLSADDMLGNSLLEMRQSLQNAGKEQAIRAQEEENRNWSAVGIAKFAEILRLDNTDMEALSDNVISNMVKYMKANQGSIFLLDEAENENDRVLELKACYAFERKKIAKKTIRQGEGLVGACFLEGAPIYMTDVPDCYINITSGLGKANPKSILICPLKINDEIFGVVEIASFKVIEPFQIEFVQKVSESIAATISTARINIRTEQLLAKTKIQAEEMINTEEQLRQNMEEMQATHEEMRRNETELGEKIRRYESMLDAFNIEYSAEGFTADVKEQIL